MSLIINVLDLNEEINTSAEGEIQPSGEISNSFNFYPFSPWFESPLNNFN